MDKPMDKPMAKPAAAAPAAARPTMEGRVPRAAPHLRFPVLPALGRTAPPPGKERDVLRVGVALAGAGEPEEQPVERIHTVGVMLTHGGKPIAGALGQRSLPAAVSEDYGQAGRLAMNLRSRCALCKHWSQDAAKPYIAAALEKMRQSVFYKEGAGADGRPVARPLNERGAAWGVLFARESVLKRSGLCRAISEVMAKHTDGSLRAPWITNADGGCPAPAQLTGPGGEDLSGLFQPRERSEVRAGETAYDTVMSMAQGKRK